MPLAFFTCMSLSWFSPGVKMLNATHPRAGPRITRNTRARLSSPATWEISMVEALACWAPRESAPARVRAAVCACTRNEQRIWGARRSGSCSSRVECGEGSPIAIRCRVRRIHSFAALVGGRRLRELGNHDAGAARPCARARDPTAPRMHLCYTGSSLHRTLAPNRTSAAPRVVREKLFDDVDRADVRRDGRTWPS